MVSLLDMNSSWKTVLIATGFNLLFEYSMRGVNNLLVQRALPLILFTAYFTLYTMLEDLIVRFRLKDYHLMVTAFFFGTVYQFLVSGAAILPPMRLGVNWTSLLFVVIVWWGVLQSVITFYIANRLAPRDWNHRRLSKAGWATALFLNGLVVMLFQLSGAIPKATASQIAVMGVIVFISALIFRRILPGENERSSPMPFKRSIALDFLSALTAVLFFICAVFLTFDPIKANTSNVNATATTIVIRWTIILAFIVLVYRLYSKRPIPV